MVGNRLSPPGKGPLYCHAGIASLCQRELDGLTLYYHRPSGITHIVDNPVPEILSVLNEDAQSLHQIAARLSSVYEMEDGEEALSALAEQLGHMAGLGLVRIIWPNIRLGAA